MAGSASISLIINATANTGALKATASELKQQKQLLNQLAAAERQRATAARAAAAQQKAAATAAKAAATGSAADQGKAAAAAERARAATAAAELAARRHRIAQTQVTAEATKTASAMQRIGSAASSAGSVASSAFSRFAGILSGIAATAGSVALAVGGIGAAGLASGLAKASGAEVQNLMSASNLGRAAGSGLAGGQALQKQINSSLLAKSGGLIDTSISKEFASTFADDVINAFGSGLNSINMTAEMANNLATLATVGGAERGQLKDVVIDFVSGALTNATLDNRDVLNNTGLTRILKQELEKSGKALEDLNPAERIALLDRALKTALPADLMQELANTATGQMAVLKNRLFGEQGLFSVMRDVFPEQGGEQTVFSQFKKSIGLLFNSDGLFAQLGRILENSGISTDLMQTIYTNWEKFNNFLTKTRDFLRKIENTDELMTQLGGFTGIGQKLAQKVNEAIQSIDAEAIGKTIGEVLNGIGGFLRGLDWGLIARKFGEGIAAFVGTLKWDNATAVVMALAAPKLGQMLAAWLVKATGTTLAGANVGGIAGAVGGAAIGGAAAVGGGVLAGAGSMAIIASQLSKLLSKMGSDSNASKLTTGGLGVIGANKIGGLLDISQAIGPQDRQRLIDAFTGPLKQAAAAGEETGRIIGTITQITLSAVQASTQAAMTSAQSTWNQIASSVQTWGQNTWNTVQANAQSALSSAQSTWNQIVSSVQTWGQNTWNTVQTNAQSALTAAQTTWTQIVTTVTQKFNEISSVISSKASEILSAIRSAFDAAKSAASSAFSGLSGLISELGSSISSALQSAKSAAGNLINQVTGGGNSQSYSGGSVVFEAGAIVVNGGGNAEQIADEVIARIEARLRQRMIFQGA